MSTKDLAPPAPPGPRSTADTRRPARGPRAAATALAIALASTLLATGCREAEAPGPVEVIVLAGQSNMYGYGQRAYLAEADLTPPANVELRDSSLTVFLSHDDTRFGPELAFAKALAEARPDRRFLLVKRAVDGASLFDWAPDYKPGMAALTGNAEYGPLYPGMLKAVRDAVGDREVRYAGLLWMQGERDATQPVAARRYDDNLGALIAALRADLGTPDLCALVGRVNPEAPAYRHVAEVNEAQAAVADEDPRVTLVETDGLLKLVDGVHYSGSGQMELGRRFAAAWLEHCDEG